MRSMRATTSAWVGRALAIGFGRGRRFASPRDIARGGFPGAAGPPGGASDDSGLRRGGGAASLPRPGFVPLLRFFPADGGLERALREALERYAGHPARDVRLLVEAELQGTYRNLAIHEQDELARLEVESLPTWYVLRDGRIHRPSVRVGRLSRALAEARDECRRSGVAIERARELVWAAAVAAPPRPVRAVPETRRGRG